MHPYLYVLFSMPGGERFVFGRGWLWQMPQVNSAGAIGLCVNWRSGSCPEILVFLFGKPDWDTWIRSSMDANSSVYLTYSATKKGMKRLLINILALRVFKKAVEFVFRTGGGTSELLEDWHGVGDTNSSSTSKRFAMFWCAPGVMSMRSLISLSQQRSVADTITILL